MTMTHLRLSLAVLALASALCGCTAPPPATTLTPTPTYEPRASAPVDTAAELIGTWTLSDPSDGMSATIHLNENGMWDAEYECGGISGEWASLGDAFLATERGGSMGCFDEIDPQPLLAWVGNTERVTQGESGWTLTDAAGNVTGTLTDGLWSGAAPQPAIIRPLPQGFAVGNIEGRWSPRVDKPGDSFLEFAEGAWQSSDGCNGNGGRWVDLGDGYLLASPSSISTQIGCENVPVAAWVSVARTAGFDGDVLVLFDAAGDELGRFSPAT